MTKEKGQQRDRAETKAAAGLWCPNPGQGFLEDEPMLPEVLGQFILIEEV